MKLPERIKRLSLFPPPPSSRDAVEEVLKEELEQLLKKLITLGDDRKFEETVFSFPADRHYTWAAVLVNTKALS